MNEQSTAPEGPPVRPSLPAGWLDRMARRATLERLDALREGELTLVEGDFQATFGAPCDTFPTRVTVTVHAAGFYGSLAFRGSLGAAESYMAGLWSCDDLAGLVRLLVRNRGILDRFDSGLARLAMPLLRGFGWLRRNTRAGSRRNIAAHYDLGNEFYELFLDETMTYSCAVFESPAMTLHEAQTAKYDRLCRKLRLAPADHVLEIGTGWGGFALHAAATYGCRVTTTTISREQHDYAEEHIKRAGLANRIELLLDDYRDLRGTYDKLVSIEMVEAVGSQFLDTFLRACSDRLKPDGAMALQAITITEQEYVQHTRTVDFIKRYIFPGSCLLSVTALCGSATRATDLRPAHMEDITPHYARTLSLWCDRFLARLDDVRAMGFPDEFIRMWEYYLRYCQGAFAEHYIGDIQMVLHKPLCRAEPILATLDAE